MSDRVAIRRNIWIMGEIDKSSMIERYPKEIIRLTT